VAFKNEKPLLSGGQAITGWKKSDGNIWTAKVPTTRDASNLKLLRIGEEQQTLARYPNFDAKNPYKGGWSHVVYTGTNWGAFGSGLGGIHTPGDWIEWKINVPSDGEYSTWFYYAAENAPYGRNSMAGRTTLQVDRQEPITLEGMSDTGSWGNMQWSRVAKVQLSRGEHTLRWTNVQGGGLNFDALVLCDDPTWIPQGTQLASPTGKNLLIIQAEAFSATQAKEMIQPELFAPALKNRFEFRHGDLRRYAHPDDAEIHIFPAWGWVSTILYVKDVDYSTRTVYVEENSNASEELRIGNRFYVSNVREELDVPGEWFFDKRTGTLFLWPKKTDFHTRGVIVSKLDRLIELQGDAARKQWVENITINGCNSRTQLTRVILVFTLPWTQRSGLSGAQLRDRR
jgi:hypothetical protein